MTAILLPRDWPTLLPSHPPGEANDTSVIQNNLIESLVHVVVGFLKGAPGAS